MQKHSAHMGRPTSVVDVDRPYPRTRPVPKLAWLTLLGPVVYAVALPGIVKIGWTANLGHRLSYLGGVSGLLAWMPGTLDDEQAIHLRLASHTVKGREWYPRTDPDVMCVVNEMRETLGLPSV